MKTEYAPFIVMVWSHDIRKKNDRSFEGKLSHEIIQSVKKGAESPPRRA